MPARALLEPPEGDPLLGARHLQQCCSLTYVQSWAPTRAWARCRWRRDRERIADFISKKREIFLVQMSLDTKRAEIRKLEERLLQREDALKKSEQMLEDDAVQFDQFLRENETKVNEAIKKADAEAKRRTDKVRSSGKLSGKVNPRPVAVHWFETTPALFR